MKKYIINWDAGYGESYEIVEAESLAEAKNIAEEKWQEEVESNRYGVNAEEYTKELAEEYGIE